MALTYSEYLKLDQLLALQHPLSEGKAHDEMLFIVIHQSYELWFKEILYEADHLGICLESRMAGRALSTLKRIRSILKTMVSQMDVLETMSSSGFLEFRGKLGTASGFQSAQFRKLELLMGNKRRDVLEAFPEGSPARLRLEQRFEHATLWDSFLRFLEERGYAVPASALNRDVTQPLTPSPQVQLVLIEVYDDPELANLCELLLDIDEGLQEWRYRHLKMVERMIGTRQGTGGSTGVEYLRSTLGKASFPDLWAIRSEFGKR